MGNSVQPHLVVEGLCAGYGKVPVLHDVSLHICEGESVALLGANNAGKSTLLRCLSGLVEATAGACTLAGHDLLPLSARQRVATGVIQIPEGRHVFPDLTVEENIRVGATRLRGPDREEQIARVYEDLPILRDLRRMRGGALSGGQQQMVAIGRALAAQPQLLLVDEPSLGLSPVAVDQVIDTLQKMQGKLTVLFVEQSAILASELCDRGYVLRQGRVVLEGDATTLRGSMVEEAYFS